MSLKQRAVSSAKWNSLSAGLSVVIQVFRTIILARLLLPEDFGLMAMGMVVISFAKAYTDLGISAAIIHRQNATRDQLSSLYWFNIIMGVIIFGFIWISMPLVVWAFNEQRLLPLLQILSLIFIIDPLGKQFDVLLQKELDFKLLVKQEILSVLVGFIVAVLCAVSGYGVWSLVWGVVSEVGFKTVLLVHTGLGRFRPSLHFNCFDLKGFIGFGLFQTGERTINFLAERLDQILIGRLLGAETLGFYNFAFNLVQLPFISINPVVTKVAYPVFSKVQHDTSMLRDGYIRVINFLTYINAPLIIGIAIVSPLAVPLIFSEKWSESVILVQILAFVALSRSIANPIGCLQLAKGRADLGFKWNIGVLLLSIPTIYLGGKIGNSLGVAFGLLILQISLMMPMYICMVRPLIGKCAAEYVTAMMKPTAMAVAMGLLVMLIPVVYRFHSDLIAVIIQIIVGALIYLIILYLFDSRAVYEFRSLIRRNSIELDG